MLMVYTSLDIADPSRVLYCYTGAPIYIWVVYHGMCVCSNTRSIRATRSVMAWLRLTVIAEPERYSIYIYIYIYIYMYIYSISIYEYSITASPIGNIKKL